MSGVADKIVTIPKTNDIAAIAMIPPQPKPQARFISVKDEKHQKRDICQIKIMKIIVTIGPIWDSVQIETLRPRASESAKA